MKTPVILASVAALMLISIAGRLHHDNTQQTPKEWTAPAVVKSTEEGPVSKTADSASQQTITNFLASGKFTKNVFIIL